FWGTGLGPDLASDTGGTSGDQTAAANIRVIIDGTITLTPAYAGRSQGFPGLDQIAVFLRTTGITLSCSNLIQISAGGVLSNPVTIATSVAGSSICISEHTNSDVNPTLSEIAAWTAAGQYRTGSVGLLHTIGYINRDNGTQILTKTASYTGSFQKISGNLTAYLNSVGVIPLAGRCTVTTSVPGGPTLGFSYLDAGAAIGAAGPNGPATAVRTLNGSQLVYTSDVVSGNTVTSLPDTYIVAGHYIYSGSGGPDVGVFSGGLDLAPELTWIEAAATKVIDRTNALTVHWTGGDPNALVSIKGISTVSSTNFASFQCFVNNADQQFTIPKDILAQLPASPITGTAIQRGSLNLFSLTQARITAPSGIDYMLGTGEWSATATVQFK
ncbi:MAG: hypothetical protein ABI995_11175, partial [Acidobacteriota bacterium]